MQSSSEINDRKKWLESRRRGIGASNAGTILGLNPFKSEYSLWCEYCGLIDPPDLSDNEAVEWGIIHEPLIAAKYTKVTGRELDDPGRYTIQTHPKIEWMIATLDRIIRPFDSRGPGALEIKTTGSRHEWEWDEDSPAAYQAQLQHQLAVMGFGWGSLAVLIGGQKFRYVDYPRNDRFIEFLIEMEQQFWDRVESGEAPPVDGSYSTKEALERLYPKDRGTSIALPEDAFSWAERRTKAKDAIKEAEEELMKVENLIRAAIGDNAVGLLGDGSGFSYRLQKRAAYTVPEKSFRVLREIKK